MAKEIRMHVKPNGEAKFEVEGYEGGTCLDATAAFEAIYSQEAKPREMVGECASANRDQGERVR